jgi:chromosome segregation ATPase
VNYFAPGLRELARIFLRLQWRLQLPLQARTLAQLESQLGLLGWQQADYDHGTQQHVDQLTDYERTQLELTNESAALGLAIQELEEQKTAAEKEFAEKRALAAANCERLAEPFKQSEEALASQRREIAKLEARIAALNTEESVVEQSYRGLLARGESAKQPEVVRLQQRVISIPREREGVAAQLSVALSPVPALENELAQRRAVYSVETDALRDLEKSFADTAEKLRKEIATRKREKQKLERQVDALEKSKAKPYREIGRALADHHIEPLNQPEALQAVLNQREKMAAGQSKLAGSLAESARENRTYVWLTWFVLLLVLGVLVEGAWILTHLRGK